MPTLFELKAKAANGNEQSFTDYKGKVLLVVNVASQFSGLL